MAGHSKWKNIQHRKGSQDKKRGKIFTKLIREITISAKTGGGEPGSNPRLRTAIDKAFESNMTKDTVQRAIARGTGGGEGSDLDEVRYEGYGPNGVAVIVDCLTDNRNRTVSEVRHAFTKSGGNLGTDGSVAYLFTKTGLISFPSGSNEEKIMEIALEAGALDVVNNTDNSIDVTTSPEDFEKIKKIIVDAGLKPEHAEIEMMAGTMIKIEESEAAQKIIQLSDMLEDLDDVQSVHTNADISEEILAEF
jgi:YebC/PmpR family DNA-binding regulatory protein